MDEMGICGAHSGCSAGIVSTARSAARGGRRAGPRRRAAAAADVVLHHERAARATAPTTAASPAPTRIASSSATAAGRGAPVTWHAYLSTQGAGAVNARDRIGNGPWYNARGQRIGAERRRAARRHDRAGAARQRARQADLADREEQGIVNGVGDMPNTARHPDRLDSRTAARTPTAMDHTCNNWTSNEHGHGAARSLRQAGRRQRLVELRAPQPRLQPAQSGVAPAAPACCTASR